MTTLSKLIKKRRDAGGSVAGSLAYGVKERLKEKIDPRQFFNQSGILTALFPGLRAYKSGRKPISSGGLSTSLDKLTAPPVPMSQPILDSIQFNTKLSAKNSMVLPAMHRDINVLRQNIIKLVKLKGGKATNKADAWFMNAQNQEASYESKLSKKSPSKIEKPVTDASVLDSQTDIVKPIVAGAVSGVVAGVGKDVIKSTVVRLAPLMFSWSAVPLAAMALVSQQAGDANMGDTQQGLFGPIERAYEHAQNGDIDKAAAEIGNINLFTAAGRTYKKLGDTGYEDMGFKAKHEARREANLDMTKDMSEGQSKASRIGSTPEAVTKTIATMKANIAKEKDPIRQAALQSGLDGYIASIEKSKITPKTETQSIKPITPTQSDYTSPKIPAEKIVSATTKVKEEKQKEQKPTVTVNKSSQTKTVPAPAISGGQVSEASVYDKEFLKLLGFSENGYA